MVGQGRYGPDMCVGACLGKAGKEWTGRATFGWAWQVWTGGTG